MLTSSLNAETLSFPSFRIDIQDDWEYRIENRPGDDRGSVIGLRSHEGVGVLKMQAYEAPAVVSEDILRNMTNLDSSTALSSQKWGEYSGYQYDYAKGGSRTSGQSYSSLINVILSRKMSRLRRSTRLSVP